MLKKIAASALFAALAAITFVQLPSGPPTSDETVPTNTIEEAAGGTGGGLCNPLSPDYFCCMCHCC